MTGGAVLDLGNGHSLWFAWDSQNQEYVTPDGDFSTLVHNQDNTFTRTLKTGEAYRFDAAGKLAAFVDRNDNTVAYAYNQDGTLASITDPNDRETAFAYSGGLLTAITDPADRTTSFTHDSGGRLTAITQPDNEAWGFGYDADGRMTSRTDPRDYETTFTYGSAGRISGVTRPDTTSAGLEPNQLEGWLSPGTGTQQSPGAAVLWGSAASTYTDGRGEVWQTQFDWTGFGLATGRLDPLGQLAVTHRDADGLPSQETDPLDRNTVYWRDSRGNVTGTIHPDYSTESFTYNSYSEVTAHTDEGGKPYDYAYDTVGNLTSAADPLDNTTSYTYTADGLVATSTDPLGRVTQFSYDSWDRLTEVVLPDGTTGDQDNPRQGFDWDDAGNLTSATDPRGNVTAMSYDTMGRLIGRTLPDETPNDPDDNPHYAFGYDARGNRTSQTDPLDHATAWSYDALGRVLSQTDPLNQTSQYAYDGEGHLTSITDPLDGVATLAYDAAGGLIEVTDPLANATSYTLDAARQVTGTTDPLSNTTTRAYNARGRVVSVTDPASGSTAYDYSSQGWMASLFQSGGGTTSYTHDDAGRVTAITDPLSNVTSLAYDDAGNLTGRTDPLNHTTSYEYDAQNRLTAVVDPLNHRTTYGYDLAGNLVAQTDPLDRTTTYAYDAQNRLARSVDPNGAEVVFGYDLAGRLSTVTDDNGNVTAYVYDSAGRLVSETDPLDHATAYRYDARGQLTGLTDRNGRARSFTYDDAGRRTAEEWLDAQQQAVRTIAYAYDGDGRLTGVSDPSATYAFAYDADGRLTEVDNTGTPGVPAIALSFGYDFRDNRTSAGDDRGGQAAYGYDLANRMTSAELGATGLSVKPKVALGYDAAGRLASLGRSDALAIPGSGGATSVDTTIVHDAADRVTGITHTAGYSTLAGYTLAWDAAGQLTQEVSNDGTVDFTYDSGGQLTGASGWRSEGYTYDGLGNRTMSGYQTGTGNRLASDGTFNYTYDNEGNLLTKTEIATGKVTEYTWDYRNRLTKVQAKDSQGTVLQESNYTYDAFDKRIGVSDDPDGPGPQSPVERWTVYDGLNPYADFDGSGTLTKRYLYGPAVDMVLARLDTAGTGTIAWYLTDHLGTVRDLADTTGQVIDHIQYDSFGKILSESSPSNGDRFKFTGREYDAATGQYYYRARYYDAATGRFIAEDPIGFDAQDANLYRYVRNHATSFVDPHGTEQQPPDAGEVLRQLDSEYRFRIQRLAAIDQQVDALEDQMARAEDAITDIDELLTPSFPRFSLSPGMREYLRATQRALRREITEMERVEERLYEERSRVVREAARIRRQIEFLIGTLVHHYSGGTDQTASGGPQPSQPLSQAAMFVAAASPTSPSGGSAGSLASGLPATTHAVASGGGWWS